MLDRPYTPQERQDIVWNVFAKMEDGKTLRQACVIVGISPATILRWIDEDKTGDLSKRYARARDGLLSLYLGSIEKIADDLLDHHTKPTNEDIAIAKLRIDARKWVMSKMLPRRLSDRVAATVSGEDGGPVQVTYVAASEPAQVTGYDTGGD